MFATHGDFYFITHTYNMTRDNKYEEIIILFI